VGYCSSLFHLQLPVWADPSFKITAHTQFDVFYVLSGMISTLAGALWGIARCCQQTAVADHSSSRPSIRPPATLQQLRTTAYTSQHICRIYCGG
jgi:hypothetical protein